MIVALAPSVMAMESIVTVNTRVCRATSASCITVATLSLAASLAVTVMVAEPAPIGVSVSIMPLLSAWTTAASLDTPE